MVCRTNMNIKIMKTLTNVFKKVTNIYLSSIFTYVRLDFVYVVTVFFIFSLVKSKQGFGNRLICFKGIYGKCVFCSFGVGLYQFVNMFCLYIYSQKNIFNFGFGINRNKFYKLYFSSFYILLNIHFIVVTFFIKCKHF